jgi:hypothetical protein
MPQRRRAWPTHRREVPPQPRPPMRRMPREAAHPRVGGTPDTAGRSLRQDLPDSMQQTRGLNRTCPARRRRTASLQKTCGAPAQRWWSPHRDYLGTDMIGYGIGGIVGAGSEAEVDALITAGVLEEAPAP